MKYILSAALLLTACGKDEKSKTADALTPSLVGTWTTACIKEDETSLRYSSTKTETTNQTEIAYFKDAACTSLAFTARASSTYTLGAAISGLDSTYQIDVTITKMEAKVVDAAAANAAKYYEISDWKVDEYRDVAGKKFQSNYSAEDVAGTKYYNIVKIQSTQYSMGDESTGDTTTAAKRPTKVESLTFTKQ